MSLLKDKKILLTGVLSNRSIAYGIAKACHREGAQLAFTYQNERFLDRITGFAKEFDSDIVLPLDVADDAQIFALAETLKNTWGTLDGVVHSIGFAPRKPFRVTFLTVCHAMPSKQHSIFPPTPSLHWLRPWFL